MKERIKLGTKILSLLLVLSLVISILPIQASAENEIQVTPQTYGEWSDVVPVNGIFEVGVEGMDVYGWSITGTNAEAQIPSETTSIDDATSASYAKQYSLKTSKMSDGNKVAAFSKNGAGHAAMTSQVVSVNENQTYRLSYKYKTTEISSTLENPGVYHGIQAVIHQLDATNTKTSYTVLNANSTKGNIVMDNWEEVTYDFVVDAGATQAIIYFEMSGSYDIHATVLFDDVSITAYEYAEVPNGKFDGISLLADGGRTKGTEGPAAWTMVSCDANGKEDTSTYNKNYMCTSETEEDKVLKLSAVNNKTRGQAKIQSPLIPITENTSYQIDYALKIEGSTLQVKDDQTRQQHTKIIVDYYTADGTYISTVKGSDITTTDGKWEEKTYTNTSVANAAFIKIGFYIAGTWDYPAEFAYCYDDVCLSLMGSAKQSLNGWTVDRQQYYIRTNLGFSNTNSTDYTSNYKISYMAGSEENAESTVIKFARGNSWGFADLASDKYTIEAGKEYQVSFDYKMTDYKGSTEKDTSIVYALRPFIRTYSSSNSNTGVYLMSSDANAVIMQKTNGQEITRNTQDTDWIRVTYRFTAPENAASCKLFFGVAGHEAMFSCNYWFDNVEIKQIDDYVDETDLLFKMLEGGNATGDAEGVVDVCDLVRMKKKLADTEGTVEIHSSADMNVNSKNDADDIKLLCWKLVGITKTEEIETP